MKKKLTIAGAYEALKGDIKNTYLWSSRNSKYLFYSKRLGYVCDSERDDEGGKYKYICTVQQFLSHK